MVAPLFALVIAVLRAPISGAVHDVDSSPRIIVLIAAKSAIRVVSRAFLIYPVYAERPAVARIAMMAMTTMSSMSVKPDCFFIRKIRIKSEKESHFLMTIYLFIPTV